MTTEPNLEIRNIKYILYFCSVDMQDNLRLSEWAIVSHSLRINRNSFMN